MESLFEADVALFAWEHQHRACLRGTTTTQNVALVQILGGTGGQKSTRKLICFLADPSPCSIPYEDLDEAVGDDPANVPPGVTVLKGIGTGDAPGVFSVSTT